MASTVESYGDDYLSHAQLDLEDIEATQLQHETGTKGGNILSENILHSHYSVFLEILEKPKSANIWGQLRWRKISGDKYVEDTRDLYHRIKDGQKDTFSIGRSKRADFLIDDDDKKISSVHCIIYCDYTQARLRFFVEV